MHAQCSAVKCREREICPAMVCAGGRENVGNNIAIIIIIHLLAITEYWGLWTSHLDDNSRNINVIHPRLPYGRSSYVL